MHLIRPALALLLGTALAGCGGGAPAPQPGTPGPSSAEAVTRVGDVTIRATAMPTATLAPAVARQYGIDRDEHRVMLLVGVRQGPEATETALPARITATVTDLRGVSRPVPMRELRAGDLLDYVGTVDTNLPDTLRFDLTVVREGGATATLRFTREFHAR